MRKISKHKRIIAAFLLVNILTQLFMPTTAFALTSGPSQPEVQSFEPVGTTQMVDMFTGDFNYNIPLMTVPGPNGGYPINLAYHAGVGLDQEASWVGLGWNINPGAINRNMRGLPDDFWGEDKISKTLHHKPQWHFGFDWLKGKELIGLDLKKVTNTGLKLGIYYNNYKGIGLTAELNKATSMLNSSSTQKLHPSGALNYDSQSGMGVNGGLSYSSKVKNSYYKFSLGVGFHSRQGLTSLNFHVNKMNEKLVHYQSRAKEGGGRVISKFEEGQGRGSGITFSNSSFVPNVSFPEGGFKISFAGKLGKEVFPVYSYNRLGGHLSFNHIKDETLQYPAYGYLYSGERNNNGNALPPYSSSSEPINDNMALMDFNRNNDGPVNPKAPYLPVPTATYDVFSVSGQGVGMVFRPYRDDIGMYYEPRVFSDFPDIDLGLDFGFGFTAKVGVTLGANYSSSYSGPWLDKYNDFKDKYEFTNSLFFHHDNATYETDNTNSFFQEPFYFKNAGDNSVSGGSENGRYSGDDLYAFNMNLSLATSISMEPKINNNSKLSYNKRTTNEVRSHAVQYKTRFDITNTDELNPQYSGNDDVDQVYELNKFPYLTQGAINKSPLSYNDDQNKKKHHLGEMSVINPDGNKYVYGLPVYNTKQKDVFFATDNVTGINNNNDNKTITYTATNAGQSNTSGEDKLYSSTETPPYAYSYLLTAVYSPDYVDLTGNGPSEDDLGYYVKFNYSVLNEMEGGSTQNTTYKWRAPLSGANRVENFESHDGDDRGSYSYGEKEIYYLNSIETKTHIAVYNLSSRLDGLGVSGENNYDKNPQTSHFNQYMRQKKLDKIDLYAKSELLQNSNCDPIKSVHFAYDYSLCQGIPNFAGSGTSGKLTLKNVWFTYRGNNKGESSKYEFQYANNPSYGEGQSDCWGNYKPDRSHPNTSIAATKNYYNDQFPYVDQDAAKANNYAGAWNMSRIILPSGGKIDITYESDDYQYVQNKKAMQLLEITGTGYQESFSVLTKASGNNAFTLKEKDDQGRFPDLMFFKLKPDAGTQPPDMVKYVTGIDKLFFKAKLKLKKPPGGGSEMMCDYVEGYCNIDKTFGCRLVNGEGCIKVQFVKVKKSSEPDDVGKTHPFRKAAFEYMKLQRPDLLFPTNNSNNNSGSLAQIGASILGVFKSLGEMVLGFYVFCRTMGYAPALKETTDPGNASYIRLNVPDGIKYGGGHRVAKIEMNDNWQAMSGQGDATYGMQYFYKNTDGTSSGVAEYEPLIGGEENPLHQPSEKYAGSMSFLSRQKEVYQEFPLCESLYPGANVGYSRVVSRSLEHPTSTTNSKDINSKSAEGITVNEFFTAKDFPVKEDATKIDDPKYKLNLNIPFVGSMVVANRGYSQGYKVELNDMHGKSKSVAVYPHNALVKSDGRYAPVNNASPKHKVEYKYLQASDGSLKNNVSVLTADGQYSTKEIGINRDFYMDFDQNRNFALGASASVDVDFGAPFLLTLSGPWPSVDYAFSLDRTFVNMKVIQRNGIPSETIVTTDNSTVSTKNLMYDANTGRPLLTQTTNNFDTPVYNYDVVAQWQYPDMGNASSNYRYCYGFSVPAGGNNNFIQLTQPFNNTTINVGDQLMLFSTSYGSVKNTLVWVKEKQSSNELKLIREDGSIYYDISTPYTAFKVINPVKKNLLNVNAGSIVALTNPVTQAQPNNFWTLFNNAIHTFTLPYPMNIDFNYTNCMEPNTPKTITISSQDDGKDINVGSADCGYFTVVLPQAIKNAGPHYFTYTYNGNATVTATYLQGSPSPVPPPQNTYLCALSGYESFTCINTCLDGVLQASASTFTNDFTYDYTDVGSPKVKNNVELSAAVTSNPWRYGKYGIWRFDESYAYQTNRKQSTSNTNIAFDGTFERFNLFTWENKNSIGGNNNAIQSARYTSNLNWVRSNKVSQYNPYGYELENLNPLGIYSSALYGYGQSVVSAVGSNMRYKQLAFEGFEENIIPANHIRKNGHLDIAYTAGSNAGNDPVFAGFGHTGKKSLDVSNSNIAVSNLYFAASSGYNTVPSGNYWINNAGGNKYVLTFWIKGSAMPTISFNSNNGIVTPSNQDLVIPDFKIDGWRRAEYTFTTVSGYTGSKSILMSFMSGSAFIDDIRLQPFNSSLKTFVYDPNTLWLMAELDERNYATFYNYDEEGSLVQVKKETKEGVVTVKTSRNNVKQ